MKVHVLQVKVDSAAYVLNSYIHATNDGGGWCQC